MTLNDDVDLIVGPDSCPMSPPHFDGDVITFTAECIPENSQLFIYQSNNRPNSAKVDEFNIYEIIDFRSSSNFNFYEWDIYEDRLE